MKRAMLVVGLCLLLTGPAKGGEQRTTLSVMDLNLTTGLAPKEVVMLTDRLLNELVKQSRYEVVERSKRDEILKEQGFQMSGACDQTSCLVEVGQLLGAQKMIGGTIGRLGTAWAVELRMIDIQTGKIDLAFSQKYSGDISMLLDAMAEAASQFSKWRPAVVGTSGVMVVSQPDQAKVIIDGADWGQTPRLVYPLETGLHQVLVLKDGYAVFSTQVQVNAGIVDSLFARLGRNIGRVQVVSRPAGARVFFDDRYKGKTAVSGLLLDSLEVMQYNLVVREKGYHRYEQSLLLRSNELTRANSELNLRRWVLRPIGFSGGNYTKISYNDLNYQAVFQPFFLMTGLGYRINRFLEAGLDLQFGHIEVATAHIKIQDATLGESEMWDRFSTWVFPVVLSLRASLPLPAVALEPYAEVGFGAGLVNSTEYVGFQSTTRSDFIEQPFDYSSSGCQRLQAGGGLKWWMSDVTGITLSLRYNSDTIKDLPTYFNSLLTAGDVMNQTINAASSVGTGTFSVGSTAVGLGLEVAF